MEVRCPSCGEDEALHGKRHGDRIDLECETCGHAWERDPSPRCPECGGADLQSVPLAILERSRGTQLSIVGTRPVNLCSQCDSEKLERFHRNRPNPLMPHQLPTQSDEG